MQQKKILLIDDEPNLLSALERALTRKDFHVMTAPNGQNGLKLAEESLPDLIVLDLSMPGMGGEIVASHLKENPRTAQIPVIFLTGLYSKEQQEQRGNFVHGQIFVAKPVETDVLVGIINQCLKSAPSSSVLSSSVPSSVRLIE